MSGRGEGESGFSRRNSGRGECVQGDEALSWTLVADFTDVADGALSLSFIFEDAHANPTTSTTAVTLALNKDVVAPSLVVDALDAINSGTSALEGDCLEGAGNVSVKVGESDAEEVSCTSSRWTFSLSSFADAQFAAVVSYKDAAENMVEVTVGPLERDVVVPTVSGDYEVVDGTYHPGGILSFAINYSEDVMVKGVPTLAFELGGNGSSATKQAIYAEGSGSSQLIFKYAISATDVDSDGIQVTNGSALTFSQGIEITDGVGNAVTASPAVKNFSNVLVATAASVSATVSRFSAGAQKTYKAGDELIITAVLGGTIDLGANDAPSSILSHWG